MGEGGSNVDDSNEGLSAALINEKGSRNKRKFIPDLPVNVPPDVSTLSLTEFPRYENLEENHRADFSESGSVIESSEDTSEEQEVEEFQRADWDDPVACQLEELLTNNLLAIFRGAVKKIVECGYTQEAAEWAILRNGLFHGSKDAISNVVDGALASLKRDKDSDISKRSVFQGLQNLVDYTILEMISVVREVRPDLTIAEAMWCLLISDLNLSNACTLEEAHPSGQEASREPEFNAEASRNSCSDSNKSSTGKQVAPQTQSSEPETPLARSTPQQLNSRHRPGESTFQELKGKLSGMVKEQIQGSSQSTLVDDKSGSSRKGPSTNSKRDMLRQKTFHFEKSYKGRVTKGAFKAKVAAWGSMVLDKSMKSQSGPSNAVMKGTYGKLTASTGNNVEASPNPSSNSQSASVVPAKDPVFALPATNPNSQAPSAPDRNPSTNSEINVSPPPPKSIDYYALIPYDENLQKYVPQDSKDETILMLVPHKQELEKEIQGWTDWANEKVMQAAKRLGKDQGELKTLRQEKEEMEKFKKERQTLEENTMKRLSEMEYALSNATGQIEVASCTVRRLEAENAVLKKEMEFARMRALSSAAALEEAVAREQEAFKKCQLWEAEKGLLLEQLTDLKRQITELENRVEKAKGRRDQIKVLLKHEEKEKGRIAAQIDALRAKREEHEALTKQEEASIKEAAEINMQKCREDIKNLQNMISELRLESDKKKIAALNVGYGNSMTTGSQLPKITKRLAVFQDNFGAGSVNPERECVMCMNEEISVVFIPCAHQILCRGCSELHEKQGMNDCPSCRTVVQKRIPVTYRGD